MPDAPWRCSQCGTVNEPVANACRTCGRWPSLFELEGSTIDVEQREEQPPPEVYEPEATTTETFEPEVFEEGTWEDDEPDVDIESTDDYEETQAPKPLWRRLGSLIVPIGIVLYIVISAIANNDGG